ncbi:acetyl-COA carboxylase, partial [Limosilactobacillus fermentum]
MNIDEPTLDALSKLLDKYHLSELTYQTGDQKSTLKK